MGALLRDLRKAAGYRSVDAAAAEDAAPSSRQTIYAYERGGLTPSLIQFLDLVEFYVLRAPHRDGAKPDDDLRAQGIAAVSRALGLPLYHVAAAQDLIAADAAEDAEEAVILDIDHVGIAVDDLEGSVERYRRTLGVEPSHRERVEDQGVEEVLFPAGTSFIQLLGSLGADTPVGRFLATRGPGVHHVAYRVDDVAASLAHLRGRGGAPRGRGAEARFTRHPDRVRPSEGDGRRAHRAGADPPV